MYKYDKVFIDFQRIETTHYQTFKITQGGGTLNASGLCIKIVPAYLKVLFLILCFHTTPTLDGLARGQVLSTIYANLALSIDKSR